jgi:hypothetical protein
MLKLEFCNHSPEGIQSCLVGRMLHLSSCSCVLCHVTVELLLCRFLCNFIDMFISSFIKVRAYQVSPTPVVTLSSMCCTSVIDWDYAVDMDFTDKMQAVWTDVQVAELVCCGSFMCDARGCKVVRSSQSIVASIAHLIKIPLYSSFLQVFPFMSSHLRSTLVSHQFTFVHCSIWFQKSQ